MSASTLRALQFQFTSSRHSALQNSRNRFAQLLVCAGILASILIARVFMLTVIQHEDARRAKPARSHVFRADIVDRNNQVLATSLHVRSVGVLPRLILDKPMAMRQLTEILPDVRPQRIARALNAPPNQFMWIKRALTPRQAAQILALGEPGLQFRDEFTRVYPQGRLAAHALGNTDPDGRGISGMEAKLNDQLSGAAATQPVRTSLDARVQFALEDELARAVTSTNSIGGFGIVMDVDTGEVRAMAAVPTFNPNLPDDPRNAERAHYNSVTSGLYELGSTFKAFAIAQGLDQGTTTAGEMHDASRPLHISGFSIHDLHPKNRPLSTTEVFIYSSNIGTALIEDEYGPQRQQAFLKTLGLLDPIALEVAETRRPNIPKVWGRLAGMTVAYGHGIAVTPLHLAQGMAEMINGGFAVRPTLLAQDPAKMPARTRVISPATSDQMRALFRLTVTQGTGNHANVDGYRVGGKTGTADKPRNGGYARNAKISTFAGVFPMDAPRYVVIASLDEPRGAAGSTGGLVAAPIVSNLILRAAPALGVARDPARDVDVSGYMPYIANPKKPKVVQP